MSDNDLIDRYLDHLVEVLQGPGREIRRALAESEDHLRETEVAGLQAGMTAESAALDAIERFGTAEVVARRYDLLRALASPLQLAAQAFLSLCLVGAFVLIGIGISGALAAGTGVLLGEDFIAGDLPGVTYTPERCAEFLEYHPEAESCEKAAVAHHFDETVGFRLEGGVLGILTLIAWWIVSRAARRRIGPSALSGVFVPCAATALFAAAAITLGGIGALQWAITGGNSGAGSFLTAGVVSLLATATFGVWLLKSLSSDNR